MKKSKTKIFALAMAAALVMSLTLPASAAQIVDMPTGWAKDAVQAAVDNGLFTPDSEGKINPDRELTRAELASVIARAFGATVEADLSAYNDVNGSWYTQPMALAVKMGVINGTGATSMSPLRVISRQEAITILARALKLTDGTAADLAAFSDVDQVYSGFVGPIAAMVKGGYVEGSNGKLNPTDNMTRATLAQMMYKIFTTYIQKSGEVTEVPEGNVMISAPDVTLKGVNVTGDLIIGDGVGEGDVTIDNCTIGGGVIVRGGGVNSIHFISTTVTKTVIITKTTGAVRVVSDTESTVAATVAGGSDTVTLEGTFTTVEVATSEAAVEAKNVTAETVSVTAAEAQVTMTDSTVATVAVTAADTTVALANTTATTVTVAQAANLEMTGETKVTTMAVTSENVTVSTTGDVVITTVQTDTTVVVTGEGTVENVTGDGEVTDTPPEPDPEPSESVEPSAPVESGDPTDIGTSNTPAPHVHSLTWTYSNTQHWKVCTASGCVDGDGVTSGATEKVSHNLVNGRCECGYSETVTDDPDFEGDAHEHVFTGEGTETTAATCTTEGVRTWTCTVTGCNATKTAPIAKAAHSYTVAVDDTAVAATCTTAGKNADMKCANCTAVQTGATIPATNHSENSNETWVKNDTYHWKVCSECSGQIEMAAHTLEDGVCTVCGFGGPEVEPTPGVHEHTVVSWTSDNNGTRHGTCTDTENCDLSSPYTVTENCTNKNGADGSECTKCHWKKPCASSHDWSNHDGTCKTCGTRCSVDHSTIWNTTTCGTCGATGTKVPTTADDCKDKANHENILKGAVCPTCGYAGQKEPDPT